MQFDIITIFPEFFDSFLDESLIKKARGEGIIEINVHNLRDFTENTHRTVDDKPFGGGRGMILKIEPVFKAVQFLKNPTFAKAQASKQKPKVILFSPRGEKFDQKKAFEYSKLEQLILICGRYEGIDERVVEYIANETISIGDYVLMGGEVAAMVVLESVARLIPGVIGKSELLKERITKERGFIDYPQYTRPEVFSPAKIWQEQISAGKPKKGLKGKARPPKFRGPKVWRVPEVLLSGHHKKIEEWRKKHLKIIE